MKGFLNRERTAAINRLRALYGQSGIISVTKKDLKDAEGRAARHGELPEERGYAGLLEERLKMFEKRIKGMKEKVAGRVRGNGLAKYIMSIPGIDIAAALPAYLGDGGRFSKPGQPLSFLTAN